MSDSPLNTSKSLSGTESTAPIITKEYVLSAELLLPFIRSRYLQIYITVSIVAIVGGMILGVVRNYEPETFFLAMIVSSLSLAAIIWFTYHRMMKRVKAQLKQAGASTPSQRNEISDQFFTTYVSDGTFFKNSIDDLFRHVERRADHYLCHMKNANNYNIIPLDAFESEADRQRFEAILRQHKILVIHKR